eukprot:m.200447 g.200447  ORF g.200447 m.200447 type:complete len:250 (+) comp15336_c0_seq1:1096-1845(+)
MACQQIPMQRSLLLKDCAVLLRSSRSGWGSANLDELRAIAGVQANVFLTTALDHVVAAISEAACLTSLRTRPPSASPTALPTEVPTTLPPTFAPSANPTSSPTSLAPTFAPTGAPTTQSPTPPPTCAATVLDLMYLVDTSATVKNAGGEAPSRNFILSTTSGLTIGNNHVRVGLANFSFNTDLVLQITAGTSSAVVNNAVNTMGFQGSVTQTHRGLELVRNELDRGARGSGVPMLVIVLTESQTTLRKL